MKLNRFTLLVAIALTACMLVWSGCGKNNTNPGPDWVANINITINPNSVIHQEINVVSGWKYLGPIDGVPPESRGIIVYRMSQEEFMAFDRTPPYFPNECCNEQLQYCTALLVDEYYPFVMDTCTNSKFLIIDGSPVEGPANTQLITYRADYDGQLLHIYN